MPSTELGTPFSPDIREVGEKCAVFGAYEVAEAASVAGVALESMQHRGQAATGIAVADHEEVSWRGGEGLVVDVFSDDALAQLSGQIAVGHDRYPTSGGSGHPQPTFENRNSGNSQFLLGLNGNIALMGGLQRFLRGHDVPHADLNDSELVSLCVGTLIANGATPEDAIIEVYPLCTGAFSAVGMTPDKLVAFCDQCRIRPLSIGSLGGGFVVASETCAFDDIGAEFIRDVAPGELVVIDKDGLHAQQIVSPNPKGDLFEYVYFSSERSLFRNERIKNIRQRMGEQLAREWPADGNLVIPVPNSAIPAARGYAHVSGIPYAEGLYRNPEYRKRTFIEPTQEARRQGVEAKLRAEPIVKGESLVVVEDSIVRGNTLKAVVAMLRRAGALEVHVRVSSPPVLFPDFYGTDIPRQSTLLAHERSIQEMSAYLGADSLGFLSLAGTIGATGQPPDEFSTSCFGGDYSIPIGWLEETISRTGNF